MIHSRLSVKGILEWVMDTMRRGNKDIQERIILLQKEKDQVSDIIQKHDMLTQCRDCRITLNQQINISYLLDIHRLYSKIYHISSRYMIYFSALN